MAEDHLRNQRFSYSTNANLVLQADKVDRRAKGEATGEVESLVGKINFKMGDRASKFSIFFILYICIFMYIYPSHFIILSDFTSMFFALFFV